jgi:ligand-binding sensor domain-containing protein/class 3 adenylate cyclase
MLGFSLAMLACTPKNKHNIVEDPIKVVYSKGDIVNSKSIEKPAEIPFDLSKAPKIPISFGNPRQIPSNEVIAGTPEVLNYPNKMEFRQGKNGVEKPIVIKANPRSVVSGVPEVYTSRDMYTKEHNPHNFSSFGRLQGLKHFAVQCMGEDVSGGLWIGNMSGVALYDGKTFSHYTSKSGLIDQDVTNIRMDKKDRIWFCTRRSGISIYDGERFIYLDKKAGLLSNVINDVKIADNGDVWLATQMGITKYDGVNFTHYTKKQGLVHNNALCITLDKKGNVWTGTTKGFSKFNGNSFENYVDPSSEARGYIISILCDKSGNIWLAPANGIIKYDGSTFKYYTDKQGMKSRHISSIIQDSNGDLFFGTFNIGLVKFDGYKFTYFSKREGMSDDEVTDVFQDRTGNYWISTTFGLNKYRGELFRSYDENDGLENRHVFSITEDNKNNIWISNVDGGIELINGSTITPINLSPQFKNYELFSFDKDRSGNIWIDSYNNGAFLVRGNYFININESHGLLGNEVKKVLEDSKGSIWFATTKGVSNYKDGKLINYTKKQGLCDNEILSIFEDSKGNIWFGTAKGISKFSNGIFTNYTEKNGLIFESVVAIMEDDFGNLWFSSKSEEGLCRFDGTRFAFFTSKEGLCGNITSGLVKDREGNIWIGNPIGLNKITKSTLSKLNAVLDGKTIQTKENLFNKYDYDDGFLGFGCYKKAMIESHDGKLWIGTTDRLMCMNPSAEKVNHKLYIPQIKIKHIDLFHEPIEWDKIHRAKDTAFFLKNGVHVSDVQFSGLSGWYNLPKKLSLAYDNNNLTFSFIGITHLQTNKVKYQYRLKGLDKSWSGVTTHSTATFGNIPPGKYIFQVKAMNSEGYWSSIASYSFQIRPPVWATWWAYTIYIIVGVSSAILLIWRNNKKLIRRARMLQQEVKKATHTIIKEKNKSDELLLNILPADVAEELKETGAAEAKYMESVTVLFTDFKGFTEYSEKLSAEKLVAEINACFSAFDLIMQKFGIEKIKTIGDAYMAAGGLPKANNTHAFDVINAAFEIQQFMQKHKAEKIAKGELFFDIRIGIHTGPVVAGIVGVKKYAYDIWGDTVNTASRMESNSEVGKINISKSTYDIVHEHYNCIHRGKISAKGKGEIDMYFVEKKYVFAN